MIKWLAPDCLEFSLISWTRLSAGWKADLTDNMTQRMAAMSMCLEDLQLEQTKLTNALAAGLWNPLLCLCWDHPSHWLLLDWVWHRDKAGSFLCDVELYWWPALVQEHPSRLAQPSLATGQSRMLFSLSFFWGQTCILVWWLSPSSQNLPPFPLTGISPNKILACLILLCINFLEDLN